MQNQFHRRPRPVRSPAQRAFSPVLRRVGMGAFLFAVVGTMQACVFDITAGNGESETESRDVGDFDGIESASFVDTHLEVGASLSVEITCDSNLLELIETSVEDGLLKIETTPNKIVSTDLTCRADITAPNLTSLANTGSGKFESADALDAVESVENSGSGELVLASISRADADVSLSNSGSGGFEISALTVRALDVDNSGSGSVELAGTAEEVEYTNSGSGSIDAQDLDAKEVVVHNTGSGSLTATASDSAVGESTGSGSVDIFGSPADTDIDNTGSGSVSFR